MSCLLLGAVLLGNLGISVTAPVPVLLAPPTQVKFVSEDYENILHWTPATNGSLLQYYVQWKIYGEPQWLDVDGCQGIQELQCDLSGVTSDPREWYYARVHASSLFSSRSAWTLSPRFSPRWDTKINPPALMLKHTKKGIVVRAKPRRPLVQGTHSSLYFKIYLKHNSGEEDVFEMDCCSNKLSLKNLDLGVLHCLRSQTILPLQARSSEVSPWYCFTL